jgi:hypothetical protein
VLGWRTDSLSLTKQLPIKGETMIQLIFMVVGVVYLFKLIAMNKNTGSHLGLDADTLAKWQGHKRTQYAWMIAAGWGSFAVMLVVAAAIGMAFGSPIAAQVAAVLVCLITMIKCYSVSSGAATAAKQLEAKKDGGEISGSCEARAGVGHGGNEVVVAQAQQG